MKYIGSLLSSVSLLAIAIVGSGCNQTSSAKYDGGFEPATLTVRFQATNSNSADMAAIGK